MAVTYGDVAIPVVFFAIVVLILTAPNVPLPESWSRALDANGWARALFSKRASDGRLCVPLDMGTAPVLGVLLLLATTGLDWEDVKFGFGGNESIQPYAIVVLFISLAYVCISLDVTGLLAYISFRAAIAAVGDGRNRWAGHLLFFTIFFLSTAMTIVTSNDIVTLTLTPVVCYSTALLKIDPTPYLIAQFFAANVWSTMLMIGNPTNIIVAQAFDIDFVTYSKYMTTSGLSAGATLLVVLYALFYFQLPTVLSSSGLASIHPDKLLKDRWGALFGSVVLAVCLVFIALSFWLHVPVWVVTLVSGVVSLTRDVVYDAAAGRTRQGIRLDDDAGDGPHEPSRISLTAPSAAASLERFHGQRPALELHDEDLEQSVDAGGSALHHAAAGNAAGAAPASPSEALGAHEAPPPLTVAGVTLTVTSEALRRVPWKIIPFVFSMFIVTNGIYRSSWFAATAAALGQVAGHSTWTASFAMGAISTILCNVMNNQPMTILLTRLLQHPALHATPKAALALRLGLVNGSNFGADLTFLGALAGIMWSKILAEKGITQITFWKFSFYGILVVPFVLAAASAALAATVDAQGI